MGWPGLAQAGLGWPGQLANMLALGLRLRGLWLAGPAGQGNPLGGLERGRGDIDQLLDRAILQTFRANSLRVLRLSLAEIEFVRFELSASMDMH